MTGFPSFTGGSSTGAIQNTCMCPPSWRVLKPPGTGSIRPAKRGVGSGISLPCDSSRSLCLKPSVTWRKMRQKLPTWTSWNGQRSSSQRMSPGARGRRKEATSEQMQSSGRRTNFLLIMYSSIGWRPSLAIKRQHQKQRQFGMVDDLPLPNFTNLQLRCAQSRWKDHPLHSDPIVGTVPLFTLPVYPFYIPKLYRKITSSQGSCQTYSILL